jgi:uracil-DNA glycosylase family 4
MVEYIRHRQLETMKRDYSGCFKCPLASLRQRVVFGKGKFDAPIMLIGEAPGAQEDLGGEPFVPTAPAGELLDKILNSVGLNREQLWITNVCLCRPKSEEEGRENRAPLTDEIEACRPRLVQEIDIVRPKIIVLAGNTPLFWATGLKGISKWHGRVNTTIKTPNHVVNDVFATYHPAALFRGSKDDIHQKKWTTFRDWQQIRGALEQQSTQDQEQRQEKDSTSPIDTKPEELRREY